MVHREDNQGHNYSFKRQNLVASLIREGVLRTQEVIDAMGRVPRELFVPDQLRPFAYDDAPLPTEKGQTISAPHGQMVWPGETWSP